MEGSQEGSESNLHLRQDQGNAGPDPRFRGQHGEPPGDCDQGETLRHGEADIPGNGA